MARIIGGTDTGEELELSSTSNATKGGVQIASDDFLEIDDTSSGYAGIIRQGGDSLIHNYGTLNLFIGKSSGNFTMVGAEENLGIGSSSLCSLTTGDGNSAIGADSLCSLTTGGNNTAIGRECLSSIVTKSGITAIGFQAGDSKIDGTLDTFIGYRTGRNVDGGFNVMVGARAGETAGNVSRCVYIGYQAQPTTPANDQLAIHNTSGNPLIGGDFSSGFVRIDDELRLKTVQQDIGADDTNFVRKFVDTFSIAGGGGWLVFKTIAPSAVAGVYTRGLINLKICYMSQHAGPVQVNGVTEIFRYFDISNAAPTTGLFYADTTIGTGPQFRLNIVGNNIQLEFDSDDGVSPAELFVTTEITAPEDYAGGLTYTIS